MGELDCMQTTSDGQVGLGDGVGWLLCRCYQWGSCGWVYASKAHCEINLSGDLFVDLCMLDEYCSLPAISFVNS